MGYKSTGFRVPSSKEVEELHKMLDPFALAYETIAFKRHTAGADQQAFDKLWEERQEIAEIIRRAKRNGQSGYKSAILKIEAILKRVS